MPVYTIRLRINVPGLGERLVDLPNTSAASIEAAIAVDKMAVIIEPIVCTKTAD